MPLTLRPTGLSRDPNAQDWNIFGGGDQPVGRLYLDTTAPTEGSRWAWFLRSPGQAGRAINCSEPNCAMHGCLGITGSSTQLGVGG